MRARFAVGMVCAVFSLSLGFLLPSATRAAIYRWDTGALLTELDAVPGGDYSQFYTYPDRVLDYADLAGADLTGANFKSARLSNAHLTGANLTNCNFMRAHLTGADMTGAIIAGAYFFYEDDDSTPTLAQIQSTASYQTGQMSGVGLANYELHGVSFAGMNLSGAILSWATLSNADFTGASLDGASLWGSYLEGTILKGASITGANLSGTAGVDCNGPWGLRTTQFYLTASYKNGNLAGIDMSYCSLVSWAFIGKNLTGAIFDDADLSKADFRNAKLDGATFEDANLTNALFTGATIAGANLSLATTRGFTEAQFRLTASYVSGDLTGINFYDCDLTNWVLAEKNLTGSNFEIATLTGVDFSGATIANCDFARTVIPGVPRFTKSQFESTGSFQTGVLDGITLAKNDMTNWTFSGKSLVGASFNQATIRGADLSGANATGADFTSSVADGANFRGANVENAVFYSCTLTGADFRNANMTGVKWSSGCVIAADLRGAINQPFVNPGKNVIESDGRVQGLKLVTDSVPCDKLLVRDACDDACPAIRIGAFCEVNAGTRLEMVFEDDDWGSTISFDAGIPVSFNGTLVLSLADDVDPDDLLGATFQLFDFDGVSPVGQFAEILADPRVPWDTSRLYTTGEVSIGAVPEPAVGVTLLSGFVAMLIVCRRRRRE